MLESCSYSAQLRSTSNRCARTIVEENLQVSAFCCVFLIEGMKITMKRRLLGAAILLVGLLNAWCQPVDEACCCITHEPRDWKAIQANASGGEPKAQYLLGRRYENGNGVRESSAQAVKWYRKAAEQGYAPAQYSLGRSYASGEGTDRNNKEALEWFARAAAQGYALARNRVGLMYERGQGVTKDYIEAYKWYTLAAGAEQNVFAVANRENLARRMTPTQIQEAQIRAAAAVALGHL
jgi:TPR repeat protein